MCYDKNTYTEKIGYTFFSFILLIRHKEYQTKERKISHEKKDMEYRNSSYAGCWL